MMKVDEPVSCILPAFNEANNVESAVSSCKETLGRLWNEFEIIIVDDGSSDGTGDLADRLAASDPGIRVIHHERNLGYGAALRSGFSAALNPWLFFTDSDGQFDPTDLEKFIPHLDESDMVVGFRSPRVDPWNRVLYGRLFSAAIRFLFGVNARDINCAFKIFRRKILDGVELTSPGALINAELLAVARGKGVTPVEVPVRHLPRLQGRQTGGSIRVILRAVMELFSLLYRIRLKKSLESSTFKGGAF